MNSTSFWGSCVCARVAYSEHCMARLTQHARGIIWRICGDSNAHHAERAAQQGVRCRSRLRTDNLCLQQSRDIEQIDQCVKQQLHQQPAQQTNPFFLSGAVSVVLHWNLISFRLGGSLQHASHLKCDEREGSGKKKVNGVRRN